MLAIMLRIVMTMRISTSVSPFFCSFFIVAMIIPLFVSYSFFHRYCFDTFVVVYADFNALYSALLFRGN